MSNKIIDNELNIHKPELENEKIENDYFYIDISDKDTILFKWLADYPYTYQKHKYCGGDIVIKNMKNYNVLYCRKCNLRVEIPQHIKTITELKKYFDKKNRKTIKKYNKFEIMDI